MTNLDTTNCAHWVPRCLTAQHKNRIFEIGLSHLQRFKNKKKTSSWNPQWQAIRNWHTISLLKYNKLKSCGKIQLLRQWKKNPTCASLLEKLQYLYFRDEKTHAKFIPRATTVNSKACATLRRLRKAGRHLDIVSTYDPSIRQCNHTEHFGHNRRYCPFTGNDHPTCSLDLAPMKHHFFRLLKQHSGNRRFNGNGELEMAFCEWVRM